MRVCCSIFQPVNEKLDRNIVQQHPLERYSHFRPCAHHQCFPILSQLGLLYSHIWSAHFHERSPQVRHHASIGQIDSNQLL